MESLRVELCSVSGSPWGPVVTELLFGLLVRENHKFSCSVLLSYGGHLAESVQSGARPGVSGLLDMSTGCRLRAGRLPMMRGFASVASLLWWSLCLHPGGVTCPSPGDLVSKLTSHPQSVRVCT